MRALLIQKDTKRSIIYARHCLCLRALLIQKDTKHIHLCNPLAYAFESFTNSKRYKTRIRIMCKRFRLRALLIQKDTKLLSCK